MSILAKELERDSQGRVQSPYWSDHFISTFDPWLEKNTGRPNLVICYGDSWTWGDSICVAQGLARDDKNYRSQNLFASRLADALDADFSVNAVPGIFNFWIHDRLKKLLDQNIEELTDRYQHIYIVIVLTELGRDFEFDQYCQHFTSHGLMDWGRFNAPEFLSKIEALDFEMLAKVQRRLPHGCSLTVARNFTDTFPINQQILGPCLVPGCWADLLFDLQQMPRLHDQKILISFGLEKFVAWAEKNQLDDSEFKNWVVSQSEIAIKMIDLLEASQYNHNLGTCHPTVFGHGVWAQHLLPYVINSAKGTDKK